MFLRVFRLSKTLPRRKFISRNLSSQPDEATYLDLANNAEATFKFRDLQVRLASPEQLNDKPSEDKLKFGHFFTDHMLKVVYHKQKKGWEYPEIVPLENIILHPAAKVLHYAIELFEGMKGYRGHDGRIRLFRPDKNMERMNVSAFRSDLPTFDGEELIKCIKRLVSIDQEWVPHSTASSLYIRPTLIGIDPTLGVASCDSAMLFVILCPVGSYFDASTGGGISLFADPKYTRACPGGVGNMKMGSNYGPTVHIHQTAVNQGLQQVLWLYGEQELLTEVGTMNIMMMCINEDGEKELVTPPLDGLILPGITRFSILELAREWKKFKVAEREITMGEVIQLNNENRLLELFGCGTACVVTPITNIQYLNTNIAIPTMNHEAPVFSDFLKTLLDIQYGRVIHPWAVLIDD